MAIKYDADLNNEIRRIVKNFNQKRNRALKRGFSYLPNKAFVSEIKTSFDNRTDLKRYLKELEKFNKLKDYGLETVETLAGGRTSRYNLMYIKDNLKDTKAFFDRQIAEANELFASDPYSIARREYLFNLEQKRRYLDINIMNLDQSGIRTFQKYTAQALNYNKSNITAYKGFLSGVEQIMKNAGIDQKRINQLYEKMANISPAQFIKMYRKSDVIAKLYDIIPSPSHGKSMINTSDEEVEDLVEKFMKDFTKEMSESTALDEFHEETERVYKEYQKDTIAERSKKIKASTLTAKQLQELKELGWMDLVDENA